ncbi:MAG TPA: ABC transporter ATP-binding protein [Parachlamydiaceae bacterium]|nr:ABC transporter ATP-binding protein [Parachlamydiaceae bacterium]
MALKAKGISKSFYTPAKVSIVNGLDLQVAKGETVAITGKSGQGKSTLLHILGTLDSPCSGSLQIMGQNVSFFNKSFIRNRHLGFIFQSFHLLDDYTALENVLMPAKIARKETGSKSESFKLASSLLEQVGLGSRAHFNSKLLSGGEKQRVAIARALCNNPDIIFADEPSGNLDKETASCIHDLLISFTKKQNKSLIMVTHDPSLAKLADTSYTLCDGKLI